MGENAEMEGCFTYGCVQLYLVLPVRWLGSRVKVGPLEAQWYDLLTNVISLGYSPTPLDTEGR